MYSQLELLLDVQTEQETPLAHNQLAIWIGQQLHRDSPLYNMTFAWIFQVDVRTDLFQQAWQRVADGSDALRTQIVERDGVGLRRISPGGSCLTTVLDLPPDSDSNPEAHFLRWCRERCARPLNYGDQLVDSVLVELGEGKTGWYLNLHHLITDASSTVLLYRQVAAEYAALIDGKAPIPVLYDYYPTLANLAAKTRPSDTARQHWADRLKRQDRLIPLYGRQAEPVGTASTRLTLQLDPQRTRALDRLCAETGFASLSRKMSRFALFATLLLSWLHRVSGQAALGFDAPVSGRPTAKSKRALGLFIEMFPFAVTVEPQDTFRTLGAKCLAEAELFLSHALPGTSSPSGAAASNVVLNFFPDTFGDFAGTPAAVEWVHPGHGDSVHALRLQVHDFAGSGGTTLHFDFNDRALSDRLRRRSLRHFERIVTALLDDVDGRIAAVDMLTDDETLALAELNATAGSPLPDQTVVEMFLAQAATNPQRIALRQGEAELSFEDLRSQAEALAATLVQAGITPGDAIAPGDGATPGGRVGILSRRSMDTVVAILATLLARAAYVPIDPAYPRQRRDHILHDSAACLVLVGEDVEAPAASGTASRNPNPDVPVLSIREGIRAGRDTPFNRPHPTLDDLAYVLYTSGSTGQPKGVLIEHGGLAAYLQWAERQYVRGDRLRFPLFTSLSFDLTVTSLFLPLITGGVLEIYPEPAGPVDSALMDVVRANAVDFIKLTPSHLSLLLQMNPTPSQLRRMVIGGEDLKTQLATEVSARFGNSLEITNEYGPTEAVVGCIAHRYDPAVDDDLRDPSPRVPIGVPADHVQIEILNAAQSPVPEGVPGELWISRYGLARGYQGLDELTAERFQARPQHSNGRRYRTGDRVRMVSPNKLEYLGRLDRQLKISGFRVEPAEIENALLSLPGIEQCAVIARRRTASPSKERLDRADGQPSSDGLTGTADLTSTVALSRTADPTCIRCGLPSSHPRAVFDRQGVCSVCRSYESIKEHARGYFKTMDDLREIFARSAQAKTSSPPYDCMMLLSGGKDSTYALCRLVEMGLSVYAFSLDNGFISEEAKDNIRRVTGQLGVPVELATTPAMNAIFRDSLTRFANVCQGCFKTIYTLSTQRAHALGIPIIVTGLSRGQMFETRLTEEMFRDGRCSPEEVDAAVLAARKVYHRLDDEVSRSLDVRIFQDDQIFEQIQYVDFYRYCDVGLSELHTYLQRKVSWVRPRDTGRSTNCLINDVGIYVHNRQLGYHNYALPYSWDVRMGHKTRDEAHDELNDSIDVGFVRKTLAEIGSDVEGLTADGSQPQLVAFYVVSKDAVSKDAVSKGLSDDELRRQLAERLPAPFIPAHLQRIDTIPLTAHGKVDEQALPAIEHIRLTEAQYRPPEGPVEEYLANVWQEQLGTTRVGADDSFFQLGGTSLGAMEVMIRLCQEYDIDLPLETLFSHPTLGKLARVAEDRIMADIDALTEDEQQNLIVEGELLG